MGEKNSDPTYAETLGYRVIGFGHGMSYIRSLSGNTYQEKWENLVKNPSLALESGVSETFPDGFSPMTDAEIEKIRYHLIENT